MCVGEGGQGLEDQAVLGCVPISTLSGSGRREPNMMSGMKGEPGPGTAGFSMGKSDSLELVMK